MIYTITFSPSIDYISYVDNFKLAALNRSTATSFYPGGKGINISRILTRLDCKTTAWGFLGGFTGQFIENYLSEEKVSHQFLPVQQQTRINVKIKSMEETDLNGPAPSLSAENVEDLKKQVKQYIKKDDWLVVSGTIPDTVSDEFFEYLQNHCKTVGAKWILDTSGPRLKSLINYCPFLIKPNKDELEELVGQKITTIEETVSYAEQLVKQGVQVVVVSLGSKGAICSSKVETLLAQAPIGKVVNTVGAGDSLVAGMMAQIVKVRSLEDAFRYGVAAGSATAFQEDLCTAEQIEQLVNEVVIRTL